MTKTADVLTVKLHAVEPSAGPSASDRKVVAETLSDITVETYRTLLRSQVVHWNVVGPLFQSIHDLTEQHYGALFGAIDVLAERIRALGHPVPAGRAVVGLDKALSVGGKANAKSMVEELIEDHEGLARLIREGAEQAEDLTDFVTRDLLTERLAFHEKAIWKLKAIVAE